MHATGSFQQGDYRCIQSLGRAIGSEIAQDGVCMCVCAHRGRRRAKDAGQFSVYFIAVLFGDVTIPAAAAAPLVR